MVPRPPDELRRLASLRAHSILDTPADPHLDRMVEAVATQLGVPIAKINLIDAERQWTKSAFGAEQGRSVPRDHAFCSYTILSPGQLFIVEDATRDPRFVDNPHVTGEMGLRFYAGAPLADSSGAVLGALAAIDTRPRTLEPAQQEKLLFLASIVSSLVEVYRVNAALRESEAHYRHAVEMSPQIPWTASAAGEVEEAGPLWQSTTGLSTEGALGRGWTQAVHPDDVPMAMAKWAVCLPSGDPLDLEYRLMTTAGTYRWFHVHASARRDAEGRIIRWYGTTEDIHSRKMADLALQESERRLLFALDVGGLGTWEFDADTGRVEASDLCARQFGLACAAALKDYDTVLAAIHPDDRERHIQETSEVRSTGRDMDIEFRTVWQDGSIHWLRVTGRPIFTAEGTPLRAAGLSVDITERRQAEQERIRHEQSLLHLANHDALTDLANRRLLQTRMEATLRDAAGEATGALFFLDLIQFRIVNDTIGQEGGDAILRQVAGRLLGCVSPSSTVARYAGDKFAVFAPGCGRHDDADALARRLVNVIAEPFDAGSGSMILGCSLGISLAPHDTADPERLRRNADMALFRAKAAGRGSVRFFEPEMDRRLQERQAMQLGLRDAMANGELGLVYQPLVDLASGRVTAFEALMRWNHPVLGAVPPSEFIPLAEEAGWIGRFGRWALQRACSEAAAWPHGVGVAVNISAVQFATCDLAADVVEALELSGLSPDRLELELTETLLLQDTDENRRPLRQLRQLGVRLALDDFGTGFSSLAYLRRFTFDKIKIDRSLVSDLPDGGGGDAIVHAIIGLGRSLGIAIIAEGVETPAQLGFLREQGCAAAQGYLFSRPIPPEAVPDYLAQQYSLS